MHLRTTKMSVSDYQLDLPVQTVQGGTGEILLSRFFIDLAAFLILLGLVGHGHVRGYYQHWNVITQL